MGVRAIVVKKKKTAQYEGLFSAQRPKAIGCTTVVQRPTNKKKTALAPLYSGMVSPKGWCFPSIPVITECRHP